MAEVPVENLVDGRRYRIESRDGMHRPFIGRLRLGSQPFGFPPEFYREFDNVILHPFEPRRIHGWGPQPTDREYAEITRSRFFETGESIALKKVTDYLGNISMGQQIIKINGKPASVNRVIPDNTLRIVESFFGTTARPRARGPNRYTPRINNNNANNKNAEKPKKPRTRKNKRKSRRS